MKENPVFKEALNNMGTLLESLHSVDSPFEFAINLVKATAKIYKADIATLFRVNPSKVELVLEAGFDQQGQQLRAAASYNLPWSAEKEEDMPKGGLTAWVAVSGKPLFIKNDKELLNRPSHKGNWDPELYPKGPENTFGCLYAVPLRIANDNNVKDKSQKDSVLGVYKIERRKDNKEGIFTEQQLKEFDLTAKQLTLVITLYERAMLRILSDTKHAVQGRLADLISELDIIKFRLSNDKMRDIDEISTVINRAQDDANNVFSWLRQAHLTYSNPLDTEKRNVKEFINDTITAREYQQTSVKLIMTEDVGNKELNLKVAESWDLHTMLISLINNAIKHSGEADSTSISIKIIEFKESGETVKKLEFDVSDLGKGTNSSIIEESQNADETSLTKSSGTGFKTMFPCCQI
jgi:hypothetical protein